MMTSDRISETHYFFQTRDAESRSQQRGGPCSPAARILGSVSQSVLNRIWLSRIKIEDNLSSGVWRGKAKDSGQVPLSQFSMDFLSW